MSGKVISIIILCLIILSTLPLYSSSAGTGEDSASTGTEKSAKAPKSPGGEVSNVRIVYDCLFPKKFPLRTRS